jgi:hypothetical protein
MHYTVILFFCKIHSNRKKKTSKGDFSIGYGAQLRGPKSQWMKNPHLILSRTAHCHS